MFSNGPLFYGLLYHHLPEVVIIPNPAFTQVLSLSINNKGLISNEFWYPLGLFCEMMATCKPKTWTQSIMLVIYFILGLEALVWLSFRVYAANLLYSTSVISINFPSSVLFTNLLETGGRPATNNKFYVSTHGGSGWSSSRLSTLVGVVQSLGHELGYYYS